MKYYNKNFEEPYKYDLDDNGFPLFTEKNYCITQFLINNDSNYRIEGDEFDSSTKKYIKTVKETFEINELEEIVTRIDKQNSTHQSSEGSKGGGNGRRITAKYISKIKDLYIRLKSGDEELVNEIAKAIPDRYTFSFASKFCTYVSRYLYNSDDYCVYDSVLCNALPYYAWAYLGEVFISTKNSTINSYAKKNLGDYKGYKSLIDRIRNKSIKELKYKISREGFDSIIWYYFKGEKDIYDKNTNILQYESRITKSLKCVKNDKCRLFY